MKTSGGTTMRETLCEALEAMMTPDIEANACYGTIAYDIHGFYTQQGIEQGWQGLDDVHPLDKDTPTNMRKNIDAAIAQIGYWLTMVDVSSEESVLEAMVAATEFDTSNPLVQGAALRAWDQWRGFVATYQAGRITPGHPQFRESNHRQFTTPWKELPAETRMKDYEVVAIVADRMLALSQPGYEPKHAIYDFGG